MQILLCAATTFEIDPTIELIEKENLNNKISIAITGVGLTAATYKISKAVFTHQPQFILQAGIAGCLDETIKLGETVVVENETIGDSGVEEDGEFKSLFQLNLEEKNVFPWNDGKLQNKNIEQYNFLNLKKVDALSVNEITTNEERILFYKKKYHASIESLEGAALHYVALMEKINFLQIRTVSNFIGERDKSKWLLKDAVANLNAVLKKIIIKIVDQ